MSAECQRIDLPENPPHWIAGGLYLLVYQPRPVSRLFGPTRLKAGHPVGTVHVISTAACGEIRGYWVVDGALELRHPAWPREWLELDAAVQRAPGMLVVDYGTEHSASVMGTTTEPAPAEGER